MLSDYSAAQNLQTRARQDTKDPKGVPSAPDHLTRIGKSLISGGRVNLARFEDLRESGILFKTDGVVQQVNPAATKLTSLILDDFVVSALQKDPLAQFVLTPEGGCPELAPWRTAIGGIEVSKTTVYFRHKEGYVFPVTSAALPIVGGGGQLEGAIQLFEQTTSNSRRRRIEFMDPQESFHYRLFSELERPEIRLVRRELLATLGSRQKFGVMVARLTNHDALAANFGQDGRAEALAVLGETMRQCLRSTDLVVQWADDRYLICLRIQDEADLETVRARMRLVLPWMRMSWWGKQYEIECGMTNRLVSAGDKLEEVDYWARS